jgi:hypothetical protein
MTVATESRLQNERYLFMVWGALVSVCQLDGLTDTSPSPTVLEGLREYEWTEAKAMGAIRYLTTSTKRMNRSSDVLAWLEKQT